MLVGTDCWFFFILVSCRFDELSARLALFSVQLVCITLTLDRSKFSRVKYRVSINSRQPKFCRCGKQRRTARARVRGPWIPPVPAQTVAIVYDDNMTLARRRFFAAAPHQRDTSMRLGRASYPGAARLGGNTSLGGRRTAICPLSDAKLELLPCYS
jgi:hypothetical protein